jgi:Flp pilus assembly protein TadD
MVRSSIIKGFGMRVVVLLVLALVSAGCADKITPDQMLASAKQERDKGNYKSAIVHLKSLLQQYPQHAEARYLLGVTYNDTGDFKGAEQSCAGP